MFRLIAVVLTLLSVTVASAQTQVPSTSRLKTIANTKTIKLAYRTDARPFSFVNEKNEPVGFTIDI
ncbi:MAG: amino acid ABC transporter substrate-binding protein, partial [Pseudolabrys sp.]